MAAGSGAGLPVESEARVAANVVLKAPGLFAVCSANGDINGSRDPGQGLFFHDTRFLRELWIAIDGKRLAPERQPAATGRRAQFQSHHDQLRVVRERSIGHELRERITVTNQQRQAATARLDVRINCGFEHIFDLRSPDPVRRGAVTRTWDQDHLSFSYSGADGRRRVTTITFGARPISSNRFGPCYGLFLEPGGSWQLEIRVRVADLGSGDLEVIPPAPASVPSVRGTQVETSDVQFNAVLQRAFDDLQLLATRQQGESFFAAGVPWFVALFGRDSLITAFEMLAYQPNFARDTLRLLARYQGRTWDDWRDEEPGKIPHEVRTGERVMLADVPHSRYYGSIDATPLFVILLGAYLRWRDDHELWAEMRPHLVRTLDWLDAAGDDGDGFIAYRRRSSVGLHNQGWKDSWNSIRHSDGSLAASPIALVEVQAYAYAARQAAAELLRRDGDEEEARRLQRQAAALRRSFLRQYWLPNRDTFALALDASGAPVATSTSNAGHTLWAGIADQRRAVRLAKTLLSRTIFNGWGLRTLAADELAYDPGDYQLGAVWPHDTAIVLAGLKRYGFGAAAERLFTSMVDAALALPDRRLPELFGGHSRLAEPQPVPYAAACVPQAWAAAALPFMLTSMLGVVPDAARGTLQVIRPRLPRWLDWAVLRDLRVGDATVDLEWRREGPSARVRVLRRDPDLRILAS